MSKEPGIEGAESKDVEITESAAQRRANRKKKKNTPDTRSETEKEIDAAIEKSSVKQRSDKARKKTFNRFLLAGLSVLMVYGVYWLIKPFQGNMAFGICKTFLELNVPYPSTLALSGVENFATSVRVWYVHTDSFGEYKMEAIQCYYKPDESGRLPYVLEKIVINRQELDQAVVDRFNRVLPILFVNKPDLTLPAGLPDSLADLKVETDRFRKPIFNR